jgi:2-polyprenyl-6-methoxyphenol hydroxylase-like FAD-dependent oxidoreductase
MFGLQQFDVIVAGGGLAGASVAAALGEFGYRVLIVEPGLDNSKRLAGELIHPPGTTDLSELGLLPALENAGGTPVYGFAVFAHNQREKLSVTKGNVLTDSGAFVLPYTSVDGMRIQGHAIEHAHMTKAMLAQVEKLPHVTVWKGARVTAVDVSSNEYALVTIIKGKRELQLRAQLLVAADGRTSNIRKMAGIEDDRTRLSTMVGYVLKNGRLPHPGFGHVFVGGPSPALAYQIAPNEVRVMFDIQDNPDGVKALERDPSYLDPIPEPLRSDIKEAMRTQQALVSANYTISPRALTKGRLVCVGDAGGCCHPLTATGISVSTRDAMRLKQAISDAQGDLNIALRRYTFLREGPTRTRMALAEALYRCFSERTPAMELLRAGILSYWHRSKSGRAASMALLSTYEGRMSVMARQYARVVGYGLIELVKLSPEIGTKRDAIVGLSSATAKYVGEAVRGLFDGIYIPKTPQDAKNFIRNQIKAA